MNKYEYYHKHIIGEMRMKAADDVNGYAINIPSKLKGKIHAEE